MEETRYALYFEGLHDDTQIAGYYADNQPEYAWSFTDDIYKAKLWKRRVDAVKYTNHQKTCSYRNISVKFVTVKVCTEIQILE